MIEWSIVDTWIVLDILIVALSALLVGIHLVLRKDSLLGDGISHSVLPGIAIGYILAGTRDTIFIFLGAIIMGVLTAIISDYISKQRKIEEGASLGVVFSGFFALGLILISTVASNVDLDPNCVLFGAVELTPLDLIQVGGSVSIPRAILLNGSVLILNIFFFFVLYRKLNISVFDRTFAQTTGVKVTRIRYIHIALVAITTVAAFETVGSILIVSLLVVPQAIGLILSRKIKWVIILGVIITSLASVLGHVAAITIPPMFGYPDTNTAGSVSAVLGIMLMIAVLVSPYNGLINRYTNIILNQILVARDDILKSIYKAKERTLSIDEMKVLVQPSIIVGRTNAFSIYIAKWYLLVSKRIVQKNKKYLCTSLGEKSAIKIERQHRMWEEYLYSQGDLGAGEVHARAERYEHVRTADMVDSLSSQVPDHTKIPGHSHPPLKPDDKE